MKKIMDALEDILCSYQGRGHQSVYVDLDSLALFTSLIAYGQIQVENYRYDYDDNIREDEEATRIYRELAPQTRWRVGQHTQIEAIRMNALKQLASLGTPTYQEQIYYADTGTVLICGEILPYEIFQLFTDMPEVKKLYVFPYPFREGWEKPLYFSFEPTEAAREEMRKYVEKKLEEMLRIIFPAVGCLAALKSYRHWFPMRYTLFLMSLPHSSRSLAYIFPKERPNKCILMAMSGLNALHHCCLD